MYTVDQIRAPAFAHSWFEAVAVVQAVASAVGSLSAIPAAEDLILEDDGTVSLGFASEASQDLAALLLQLLEGTAAPAELSLFAGQQARSSAGASSVAEFTEALAFFERPDGRSIVRGVVERLAAGRLTEDTERAMERLRERVAGAAAVDEGGAASVAPADSPPVAWYRQLPALMRAWSQR